MSHTQTSAAVLARLSAAVHDVVDLSVDDLDDLDVALKTVQGACDRLEVVRAQLIVAGRRRQAHARGQTRPGADSRARRQQQRDDRRQRERLQDDLGMTGPEAARAQRDARDLDDAPPAVAAALRDGRLRVEQARVIVRAARDLTGHPDLEDLIAELLDAAVRLDAIALGRLARRRIGELDPDTSAATAARATHQRRASFITDTDGSVRFHGQVYGLAAERLLTAIRAFTRPDPPDTPRQPQQRTADALDDLAAAALDRGLAPTDHGQRPHIQITIPLATLLARHGNVDTIHTGTLPFTDIAHLLDDAVLSRCILDSHRTPLEVSTQTRTVPHGLWRALIARDRHCRWPGCDAPPAFCDVAHGPITYRNGGRLSPANAALLCRTHHRRFDNTRTTIHINGNTITFHPPDHPTGSDTHQTGRPTDRQRPTRPIPQRPTDRQRPHRPTDRQRPTDRPAGNHPPDHQTASLF